MYIFGFQACIAYNVESFSSVSAKSAVAAFRVNNLGVPEIPYIALAVSNDCELMSSRPIIRLQVIQKRKDLILKMTTEIFVETFQKLRTLHIPESLGLRHLFNIRVFPLND
jgi:hypothetical protein